MTSQLIYDFFYFYSYEFDPNNQVINIKDTKGFSDKVKKNKYPYTIVDPFEDLRNPGVSV